MIGDAFWDVKKTCFVCEVLGFLDASPLPQCRDSLIHPPAFSVAAFVCRLHKHPLHLAHLSLSSFSLSVVLSRVFEFFLSLLPVLLTSPVPLLIYIFTGFASSCTVYTLVSCSRSLLSKSPHAPLFILSCCFKGISPFVLNPFYDFVCSPHFTYFSYLFFEACGCQEAFHHYKVVCTIQCFLHSNE